MVVSVCLHVDAECSKDRDPSAKRPRSAGFGSLQQYSRVHSDPIGREEGDRRDRLSEASVILELTPMTKEVCPFFWCLSFGTASCCCCVPFR